ncbi:hypothetical protein ACFLWN_04880 [Chloroflexota bacterium]
MADEKPMNPLFFNRTISQVLKMFILPEIEKRISSGAVGADALPIEIYQFRASQNKDADGHITPIAEINEEVKLIAEIKHKNKKSPGEAITIQDIYPEQCFLNPPEYNGQPAGYFYWRATFLDSIFIFDLSYNAPDEFTDVSPSKTPFPILQIVNAKNFVDVVKPLDKFRILSSNNWPPAPGYCPQIMNELHKNPELIADKSFVEIVSSIYNHDYWINKMDFWVETDLFPERMPYIQSAIKAHYEDDFIASIYVIVPQFEGIITDYIDKNLVKAPDKFSSKIDCLRDICLSRNVILYPKKVLEEILGYIANGSFWKYSGSVKELKEEINRHGIVHGAFKGFECKEISLKYLILFDAMSYVLLNDRVVIGDI